MDDSWDDPRSQMYCEQKLLYTLIGVPRLKEMGYDVEEGESPQVTRGSDIHMARQLEVQDVSVRSLLCGEPIAREVPVFGRVLYGDIFVNGVVDEVRCDRDTLQVDIVELKTIRSTRLPSAQVRRSHRLQVMLYHHLLSNLVQGNVDVNDIEKGFRVNMDVKLSSVVLELLPLEERHMNSLSHLVPFVLSAVQGLPLPSQLLVEYFSQETNNTLRFEGVEYNQKWLMGTLQELFPFWTGERPAEGVHDIEDAWKCKCCPFQSICEWRQAKEAECIKRNSRCFVQTK
ncbi:hypothetical protein MRX96_005424 [Rhipicephalus microplus]